MKKRKLPVGISAAIIGAVAVVAAAIITPIITAILDEQKISATQTAEALSTKSIPTIQPTEQSTKAPLASQMIFDDLNSNQGFQSSSSQLYISQGKLFWNVSRSGGAQFIYREIPAFKGNVRLTVVGQINDWTNNCGSGAGIGDKPGSGLAVYFGYYGGGCPTSGPFITASGASFNVQENPLCTFVGDWLWTTPKTPAKVELTTNSSSATLTVDSDRKIKGIVNYLGNFTTLWVGMNGDGDWPSCSGEIDSIKIEPLQ